MSPRVAPAIAELTPLTRYVANKSRELVRTPATVPSPHDIISVGHGSVGASVGHGSVDGPPTAEGAYTRSGREDYRAGGIGQADFGVVVAASTAVGAGAETDEVVDQGVSN